VITDEGLSPAAEDADIVLPVTIDGIPFDSFASLLVLVEALVEGVFHAVGTKGIQRMKDWEESVHIYRAFRADPSLRRTLAGNNGRG
jgi:DNA-binding MurR/RpiR family transcriptional regulator